MPYIRPDGFLLSILLFCVPVQYLLVHYWGHSEIARTHALNDFISKLVKFQSHYLEWESWKKWCWTLLSQMKEGQESPASMYSNDPNDPLGESPAVEVMRFKQKKGYFGFSPEPRIIRSPHVKFRVGQVVIHKYWKYRGVVIGWDEKAKAPKDWLSDMHGKTKGWRDMPNYAILVDVRDRLTPQLTYVPEENLEVVKNMKIMHPLLDNYFEKFDGAQYIPRPWLTAVYPQD